MTSLLGLLYPCLPLGWVSFERTEGQRGSEHLCENGVHADDAGDSSAATNRIDSTIAPADQLSPGSVGVSRAIEGIGR